MADAVIEQFDRFFATFRPRRSDDLRDGVTACIGMAIEWEAAWMIEEGEYAGQWAMQPTTSGRWPFAWAPESDLVRTGEG